MNITPVLRKLSEREAKWVSHAQCPGRLEYKRRHRRWAQGILAGRIIREVTIAMGTEGFNDGDIIQFGNSDMPLNMQGLFKVKLT